MGSTSVLSVDFRAIRSKVCWTYEQRGEVPGIVQSGKVSRRRPDLRCILHIPRRLLESEKRRVNLYADNQVVEKLIAEAVSP